MYEYIGLICVSVGIVLMVGALFKQTTKYVKNRVWAFIFGGILLLAGWFGLGANALWDEWTVDDAAPAAVIECCTFDITPTGGTTAILNSAKDGFTVPCSANTSAHTIRQQDNSTAWTAPVMTFVVRPDCPIGATADDLAKLYYEVYDSEVAVDTSTDSYKLFTKSGGNRQLVWTGDGTHYVEGVTTLAPTGNVTLTLTITVTQDSFSRIEDTYDPVSVVIKFSNGCGWTETFDVDFMVITQHTT
jgi:hypothetical protein